MITDFPNKFKEGKPIIDTIPEEEYENFLAKCLNILPNLLDKGDFTLDLPLTEKQTVYERASNRVKHFIEECCTKGIETPTAMLLKVFNEKFAIKYGCRTLTKQGFNEALGKEGYETYYKEWGVGADRHHQVFVCGISLKADSNTGDPNLSGQISQ
jgi:phage/plasmid-associated DNA primase